MRKFLTNKFSEKEANVIAFGVPLGEKSKEVLKILRKASYFVEPYDVELRKNLLENVKVFDLGNLKLKNLDEITQTCKKIISKGKIPFAFGRSHLITYYSLKALPEETRILIFDAHADSKEKYLDEKISKLSKFRGKVSSNFNDATWLRKIVDEKRIALLGLRSCDEDEISFLEKRALVFTSVQIKKFSEKVKLELKRFLENFPVYISVDLDVFDPSIAPSVDYPEPNGIFFEDFRNILSAINNKLFGFDLVCLKPEKNEVTQFLAIKVIFEILSHLKSFSVG
jgi:agmatinase